MSFAFLNACLYVQSFKMHMYTYIRCVYLLVLCLHRTVVLKMLSSTIQYLTPTDYH